MKVVTGRILFSALLASMLLLPAAASAYTTPGTGVNWTTQQLADSSGGSIVFDVVLSRYESSETITIAAGDTAAITTSLHIDTSFASNKDIVVHGMLTIGQNNVETDSVYISGETISDTTDGPGGIKVEETGHLTMVRTVLDGGGADGQDDGVYISGGEALIQRSTITGWMGYATRISSAGIAEIVECLYKDNMEYTMSVNLSSSLTLTGSTLEGNNLNSPSSGKTAINIGTQGSNTAEIDSCTITGTPGNRSGGISVWNFTGTSQIATITSTTIENCAFGINVQGVGAYAEITDCTLQNNTAYSNAAISGSGVSIYAGGEAYIAHNTITGNYWGITIPSGGESTPATAHLGVAGSAEYKAQGGNLIYGNENNGVGYNLYNNTALVQLAENNYWGSADYAEIDSTIIDGRDNASLGIVDIFPLSGNGSDVPSALISSSPASDTVIVEQDSSEHFSVEVLDPDDETTSFEYAWSSSHLPDSTLSTNAEYDFTADLAAVPGVTLTMTATGNNGNVVTREWTVLVNGTSSLEEMLLPTEFSLSSYPNPFNAEARIRYALPNASHVRITVYDILGRQVSELADGLMGAGVYDVTFNANALSSGVYFLRFESERWSEIRKITLVR